MSKIYLQEKITPVANKYIIVGSDGNLTAGDLPTSTLPTIEITVPSGSTNVQIIKDSTTINASNVSSTLWKASPTSFGVWTVSCLSGGTTLSDNINITLIKIYSVDLTQ